MGEGDLNLGSAHKVRRLDNQVLFTSSINLLHARTLRYIIQPLNNIILINKLVNCTNHISVRIIVPSK